MVPSFRPATDNKFVIDIRRDIHSGRTVASYQRYTTCEIGKGEKERGIDDNNNTKSIGGGWTERILFGCAARLLIIDVNIA